MSCSCNRTVLKGDKGDQGIQGIQGPAGTMGYDVYKVLLTQSGTSIPTVVSNGSGANTPLENTIGGTPVYTYVTVGTYRLTITGAFPAAKTYIKIDNPQDLGSISKAYRVSDDVVEILTEIFDPAGPAFELVNTLLYETSFEIQVYP